MLTLKLRGGTWYVVGHHNGRRIRRSTKTSTRTVAEGIRVQMEHELVFGSKTRGTNGSGRTFSSAVDSYLKRRNHTSKTTRDYLHRFTQEWEDVDITDMNTTFIEDWLDSRLDAVRPQTVRREMNCFMPVLRHARKRGWIEEIPDVERPADGEPRLRVLDDDEYQAVMDGFDTNIIGSGLARFLLHTGARIGEAINLRFEDCHAEGQNPHIILRTRKRKGGREATREIPINQVVMDFAVGVYGPVSEWPKEGRCFRPWADQRAAGKAVKKYVESLGITDFRPHDLRRTFATRLLARGVRERVVADLLGHTDLTMVMRYAIPPSSTKRDAVNALGV